MDIKQIIYNQMNNFNTSYVKVYNMAYLIFRHWSDDLMFRPFGFIAPKTLNYLVFESFDFERTWWGLSWRCVVHTKFVIYILIMSNEQNFRYY
jgi:hypothetical protein